MSSISEMSSVGILVYDWNTNSIGQCFVFCLCFSMSFIHTIVLWLEALLKFLPFIYWLVQMCAFIQCFVFEPLMFHLILRFQISPASPVRVCPIQLIWPWLTFSPLLKPLLVQWCIVCHVYGVQCSLWSLFPILKPAGLLVALPCYEDLQLFVDYVKSLVTGIYGHYGIPNSWRSHVLFISKLHLLMTLWIGLLLHGSYSFDSLVCLGGRSWWDPGWHVFALCFHRPTCPSSVCRLRFVFPSRALGQGRGPLCPVTRSRWWRWKLCCPCAQA